jgi:raffinose/stachyose/melibiose transport system substrate-binding protein
MHDIDGTFYTDKYVLNLTPYLNADPAWKAGFDQQSLAFTRTNGFQWGLNPEVDPVCMVWNTRILEQAGVGSVPATWSEFTAALDKIKRIGVVPGTFQAGGGHMFHDIIVGQNGGYAALAANKFDAPQILKAMQLLKTFVDNKWVAPDEVELTWEQADANFQQGRLGFYMDGMWTIANNITASGAPKDLRNHVAFSAFPAIDHGTVAEQKVATTIGVASSLANDATRLNATLTFLKFWFTEQMAAKWVGYTWSPMGVTLNLNTLHGLPTLPAAWLKAAYAAKSLYTLPATPAMQDQQWADFSNSQTLLLQGKSAEAALEAYVKYLAPYMKKR